MEPCNWPVVDIDCPAYLDLGEDKRAEVKAAAIEYLWNWTGQQYGLCTTVLRPCRTSCTEGQSTFGGLPSGRSMFTPVLLAGKWFNIGCGSCGDSCGCGDTPSLTLPGPVQSIEEVIVDGVVLPPAAYRVDSHRYLVRLDGGRWPTCQNMGLDPTQPGTWQVTYTRGIPVPMGGQRAAATFACELAKAMAGDKSCALPARLQSVTRQGVSITVLDSFDDIDKGHTGIWTIDSWVASVTKSQAPSVVLSPDRSPARGLYTSWRSL